MIKYLEHKEIDFEKYDQCIAQSKNSLIYAYSWYLDVIAKNWDALVLADYEMVMPLTHRKKHGISYIFLPAWAQQLGVFSVKNLKESIVIDFLKAIPRKFKVVDILLNYRNYCSMKNLKIRNNYILDLNSDYQLLYKNFTKGRKGSIKQGKKYGLIAKESINADSLIELFLNNKGLKLNKPEQDYTDIRNLVSVALKNDKVKIYNVYDEDSLEIGGAIFLKDKNRITYLFSAVDEIGRDKQAMSFLIDLIIKKYASQELILDFEGSMIQGIADFFKSFNAVQENYYWYATKRII